MQTINIHGAKKHLSRLIDMVKVTSLVDPARQLGFMAGQMLVPDDFDAMGTQEIEALFSGI